MPAWWMNGTSESRWRRKTSSVASSFGATRSRKRLACRERSPAWEWTASIARDLSEALHGIEAFDLVEPAVAEAVDLAGLEVPPGDLGLLLAVGVAHPLDVLRDAHLLVDAALVLAPDRGDEVAHAVDDAAIVDLDRRDDRAPREDALGHVLALEDLEMLLLAVAHADAGEELEVIEVAVPGPLDAVLAQGVGAGADPPRVLLGAAQLAQAEVAPGHFDDHLHPRDRLAGGIADDAGELDALVVVVRRRGGRGG